MRRAARTDDNHAQIVEGLRRAGCFVQSLAPVGKGCPDLLAAWGGRWCVLEVKDGAKPQSARKLTPAEVEWIVSVKNRAPVHVVESVEQAIRVARGGDAGC